MFLLDQYVYIYVYIYIFEKKFRKKITGHYKKIMTGHYEKRANQIAGNLLAI